MTFSVFACCVGKFVKYEFFEGVAVDLFTQGQGDMSRVAKSTRTVFVLSLTDDDLKTFTQPLGPYAGMAQDLALRKRLLVNIDAIERSLLNFFLLFLLKFLLRSFCFRMARAVQCGAGAFDQDITLLATCQAKSHCGIFARSGRSELASFAIVGKSTDIVFWP